jgi:hypothetical protein
MATDDLYVSADELAEYLRMDPPAEDAGDTGLSITAASTTRWVNNYCGRNFNLADEASARYFDVLRDGTLLVDDIGALTDFAIATDSSQDGTYAQAWLTTDYQVNPLGAITAGEPVTSLLAVGAQAFPPVTRRQGLVRVTAMWGWPAVPSDVKQATLIQAARLYKRHESPDGVLGGADFGIVRVGSRVDPDVAMLLAPYRYISL